MSRIEFDPKIKKRPYGDYNVSTIKSNMKRLASSGQVHFDVKNLPNIINGSTSKTSNTSFSG